MDEKKNNKGLIWLIVILIVLVLGLVGFIIYDKILLDDKTSINNDETTTTTIKNINSTTTITQIMKEYPIKNDDNVISFDLVELYGGDKIDLTKNFQNVKLKIENLDYIVSCTDYNEENEECTGYEISINNVILSDYDFEGFGTFKHIIINKDYLFEHEYSNVSRCGFIRIYKNGRLIYTISNVNAHIDYTNDEEELIKYKNNKLYYFVSTKDSNVLKLIDFDKEKIVETELGIIESDEKITSNCYNYQFG